jgi:hypothetical protein
MKNFLVGTYSTKSWLGGMAADYKLAAASCCTHFSPKPTAPRALKADRTCKLQAHM